MEITEVKIRKVESHAKIKACASIIFDNVFAVHDIKVIEGNGGVFVAMPSRVGIHNGEEKHMDIAHPIRTPFREYITKMVLDQYNKIM